MLAYARHRSIVQAYLFPRDLPRFFRDIRCEGWTWWLSRECATAAYEVVTTLYMAFTMDQGYTYKHVHMVFGEYRKFRPVLGLLTTIAAFRPLPGPVKLSDTCIRSTLCECEKSELMNRQTSSWVPTAVSAFRPIYELRNSIPHLWRQAFQHLSYSCCAMSARYYRPAVWYYLFHIQKNKTFRDKNYPTSRNNISMEAKKLHFFAFTIAVSEWFRVAMCHLARFFRNKHFRGRG